MSILSRVRGFMATPSLIRTTTPPARDLCTMYSHRDKVRISADSASPHSVEVSIGERLIPVFEIDIHMAVDHLSTITLKTRLDQVDVAALQKHTTIKVEGLDS